MKIATLTLLFFVVCSPFMAMPITFVPLVEHSGSNDPLTEGFGFVSGGGGVSTSAVANDLGLGIDAWKINDFGQTAFVDYCFYEHAVTSSQATEGNSNGWRLALDLRAIDFGVSSGPYSYSVGAGYGDGTTIYGMNFMGSESSSDITVLLTNESPFTLTGIGSGYHSYEFVFDPLANSVDFLVDGLLEFVGVNGEASTDQRVSLGGGDSNNSGQGNYSLLQWGVFRDAPVTSVPEPSTLALLSLGLVALVRRRGRKRIQRLCPNGKCRVGEASLTKIALLLLHVVVAMVPVGNASAAQIGVANPYVQAVMADNPIAYYRFEETSGTTAANQGTLGVAANGMYTGGFTQGQPSFATNLVNSIELNGTDAYIDLPALGTYPQVTLEAWVNIDDLPSDFNIDSIYSTDTWGLDPGHFHFNLIYDGSLEIAVCCDVKPQTAIGVVQIDTWHHVVQTYDGSAPGEYGIYVDGVKLVDVTNLVARDAVLEAAQIGAYMGTRHLDGNMDEFAVYNTVLSEAQVLAHFNAATEIASPTNMGVPEPSTLTLAALGLLALLKRRRRRA